MRFVIIGLGSDMFTKLGEALGEKLSLIVSGFFGISIGVDILHSLSKENTLHTNSLHRLTFRRFVCQQKLQNKIHVKDAVLTDSERNVPAIKTKIISVLRKTVYFCIARIKPERCTPEQG